MIFDKSKIERLGTLWEVGLVPLSKDSVEMQCGLYLNPVLITEKEEIKGMRDDT